MSEQSCPICSGKGWLLVDLDSTGKLAIQRCDNCQLYPATDNEAVQKVARLAEETPKLIAALTWLLDDLTDAGEDKSESGETFDSVAAARTALANAKAAHAVGSPCPYCGREENGKWFEPCPSDDCPSHGNNAKGPQ